MQYVTAAVMASPAMSIARFQCCITAKGALSPGVAQDPSKLMGC